jgi:microcystin degradation protein MlrC
MRIAIGGIYHESNSFASSTTTVDDFRASSLLTGGAILDYWRDTNSEIAGFVDGIEGRGWEPVPTLMAWGMPSGPLNDEAFTWLEEELCARIRAESDISGVLLVCHGAMVSCSLTDPDAHWLRRVRETVGPRIPVVATADFHANLTPGMLDAVDALVGYRTYPHTDYRARGNEAASILARTVRGELRPETLCIQLPLIPNLLTQFTGSPPMRELVEAARAMEDTGSVVSSSVFGGFQWANVPHNGISLLAVTNGANPSAFIELQAIARRAWDSRKRFCATVLSPEVAVREALGATETPVVLVDTGDNVGGGTPGDGTVLLAELLRQGATNAVVLVCDPEAVTHAASVGVRNSARFRIGGRADTMHGDPVEAECVVKTISDGLFTNVGPMRDGIREDMGRTAVLICAGIVIVATEKRSPMWNLQQLRSLGIEPTELQIIVVKAAIAHRAAYSPIAGRMIEVDTPGITALDIRKFSYDRLRRPVFPLDDNFDPFT